MIALHLALEYRVFVVGFVPGFAYMAPVDPRIAAPRRTSPRLKVPAGRSPWPRGRPASTRRETPGGWSLIGRCPVKPYDPDRPSRSCFIPGIASGFIASRNLRTAQPPSGVTCEHDRGLPGGGHRSRAYRIGRGC